jgi:hypothetical protein
MRNSEMILSGLEPVWLHDSSPVICNHIPVRFPPYVPNILPLRSLRGKRKKVLIFAGSRLPRADPDGGAQPSSAGMVR